jgi:hypothetical protein
MPHPKSLPLTFKNKHQEAEFGSLPCSGDFPIVMETER